MFLEMGPEFHMWPSKCIITVPLKVLSDVRDQMNWNLTAIISFR